MNYSKIIKLFLPPIYYMVKEKFKRQPKLQRSPLPQIKHNSNKIIIIGNGPSLNNSIELYKDEIVKHDRICVNFFASSNLYEVLQPNIYVFADPAFFWVPDNQVNSIRVLFDNLVNKTTWTLSVFIPIGAKDAPTLEWLRVNHNIKIEFYNNLDQNIGKMSKFEAWDKNLIAPPAQNVLNVCIYLALFWGYPETYLIGADSSFLEDIRVDQQTNELYSWDHHFYERDEVYTDASLFDDVNRRRIGTTLDEELRCQMIAFKNYKELEEYSRYKEVRVYNASEYSWIDAFERKKLL